MGNWYTATNTNSIRTSWIDSLVYPKPYATAYNSSNTGTFPSIIGETGSESVKRISFQPPTSGLSSILPFIETKTVWHPKGK